MKKNNQLVIFKLSVLSTLLLCATANNYASDIEIYKAATAADGNAKIMLVLDVSGFMYQDPGEKSGGVPINTDFGTNCNGNPKSFLEVRYKDTPYEYTANYCEASMANAPEVMQTSCFTAAKPPISSTITPAIPADTYRCYDRLSTLKQSLIDIIDEPIFAAAEDPVAEPNKPKISLGFSFYPTGSAFGAPVVPQLLNAAGRNLLKKRISDLKTGESLDAGEGLPFPQTQNGGKSAQVAQAYGRGVKTLIDSITTSSQCSGYGVYTLAGGPPVADNLVDSSDGPGAYTLLNGSLNASVQASNPLNSVCNITGNNAGGIAWGCVEKAAELFKAGKSRLNMPLRTAVVSMGKDFGFYGGINTNTDFDPYSSSTTLQTIDQKYTAIDKITNNNDKPTLLDRYRAIRAGTVGGGGYYAVANRTDLKASILSFIAGTTQVEIPYLTTGAPTIPQDPLNPALVQNKVYYSQFKPTPTTAGTSGDQLWLGNLKKYRINDLGEIIAKNDIKVIDSLGRLVNGTYDYWAPSVSTDPAIAAANENTPGSELYARMGGVRSQLPLGTSIVDNITVENRKLLTNRVVSNDGTVSERTTLTQIKRADYGTNGTAASDPKKADIVQLLDLRQVGAVMHSSPLLLTNKGKVVYDSTADSLSTTNREDYILFGSTQGLLHVVKADDYTSSSGGGKEVFAFVPHEMVEKQNKAFSTPDQATGGTANLFYGIDAPWTAYTEYVVDSSGNLTVGTGKAIEGGGTTLQGKQMVYGGLRMGGRSYYALNLGDMTNPRLMFHIDPKDQKVYYNNSSKTFSPLQYMGESWSKPKIAWVKWDGTRKLVMFVGGGYDAGGTTGNANNGGYESDSYNQTNGIGAGVYMFDALNGDLLWWASNNATATSPDTTSTGVIAYKDANLKYSVVSEIKTADRNNDGLVDNLYFGDLSGQVFRIDLNNNASTIGAFATRVVRLLNAHESSGEKSPRFYAAPGFSIYKDKGTGKLFAAISIGSGNLSRPLVQYAQNESRPYDALYTIYDKDVTRADLYTTTSLDTQDVTTSTTATKKLNEITDANRFNLSADAPVAPYESSYGWYYKFKGDSTSKPVQQEKLFYSPTVIDNDLYISSYDSDKLGLTGVCGGGVQGESKVRLFCMPFGQCLQSRGYTVANSISKHGPGIQNHAIGGTGGTEGGTTRLIGGAILDSNLDDKYQTKIKFIPQRWYQRY